MAVVIETTLGDLTVDLFIQERPKACLNFLKLCKLKYYNFNLFHNVEHGFIAQTGDPTGAGDGGESVWGVVEGPHKRYFEGESLPKIRHSEPGLVSMVSVGKNMIGSQFFFTLGPDLYSLDGVHCVIGEVAEGHEVLRKLNEAIVDEKFRPYQDIRITHTVILEDPFDDPRGFQIPSRSPSPTPERFKNGRIGADEDIDDTEGKSIQEIQEMLQEREAKARATILEIVGDLPDADIAPPENVLFVCKLNPVTNDDDLEIIFSRFGKVKCCEVIRDKITGDSLQYAFVEFEDKKSCEQAYFKMDNVLIDDRRIHVDFSQSVAKVRWRGKGRGVVHENKNSNGRLDFNNLRGSKKEKGNFDRRDVRGKNGSPGPSSRKEYPERRRYDDRRPNNENNDRRSNRDNRGRFDKQDVRHQNRDERSSVERSSYRRPNKDNWKDDRERYGRDDGPKSHRDDRDRLEKNDDRRRNKDYRKDDNVKERDYRQRFERSDRNFDREIKGADRSSNVRGENDRGRRNEERPGPSQDSRNRDRERYRDDRDRDRREDRRQDEYHHRRREDSRSPAHERVERKKSPEKILKREPTPEHKHSSKEVSKKRQTEEISKKVKKHRKKSETSSDSDSSSSSDSDKRKRKKKKKTKKRRRKRKRSSSSSSSSSTD